METYRVLTRWSPVFLLLPRRIGHHSDSSLKAHIACCKTARCDRPEGYLRSRTSHPPLRDHAIEDGGPFGGFALNDGCKGVKPAGVYDFIASFKLNNHGVVERRSAENFSGVDANHVAASEARHVRISRYPFREGDFDARAAAVGWRLGWR